MYQLASAVKGLWQDASQSECKKVVETAYSSHTRYVPKGTHFVIRSRQPARKLKWRSENEFAFAQNFFISVHFFIAFYYASRDNASCGKLYQTSGLDGICTHLHCVTAPEQADRKVQGVRSFNLSHDNELGILHILKFPTFQDVHMECHITVR